MWRDWISPLRSPGVGGGLRDLSPLEGEKTGLGGTEVGRLLESPNFGATSQAVRDLERDRRPAASGVAPRPDKRAQDRSCPTFKEGHYFLPGVPDGPRIPEGYGKAGGLPSAHHGRAADVWWVDGKPVEGNATAPGILEVGKILAGIPPGRRPDQIIGPPAWIESLGYGRRKGGYVPLTSSSCTGITSIRLYR